MRAFPGLATSCYTTSLAAVIETGEVVFDGRVALAAGRRTEVMAWESWCS